MAAPGLLSHRRFSAATRLRVHLAFAQSLESLVDTYKSQAAEFVRRLKSRLGVEQALERYFREVAVPSAIEETVRCRALISLSGLIEASPAQERSSHSWSMLRPDHLLDALRRRVEYVEATNLECRLAASMSDEAVAATHVRGALDTARVLADELTPDEAIMYYIRTFNLPAVDGQVIYRKALAQWAELHPLPGEGQASVREPSPVPAPALLPRPKLERARPEFGIRVMV